MITYENVSYSYERNDVSKSLDHVNLQIRVADKVSKDFKNSFYNSCLPGAKKRRIGVENSKTCVIQFF